MDKGRGFDRTALRRTLATAAIMLAGGCSASMTADQPTRLCVDNGGRRLADSSCTSGGSSGGHAYYVGRGTRIPAEGEAVSGGSTRPAAGTAYTTVSAEGVSRGGFGGSGEGGGEGGGGHGGGGE